MAAEKEETLYVGMMRDKYELLREGSLQCDDNAFKFLYFAALPKSKSATTPRMTTGTTLPESD